LLEEYFSYMQSINLHEIIHRSSSDIIDSIVIRKISILIKLTIWNTVEKIRLLCGLRITAYEYKKMLRVFKIKVVIIYLIAIVWGW
jgi:hypothetical protein